MKFRYLLIDETGVATGANYLGDTIKELFQNGTVDIIDCQEGERMTQYDNQEWESIEDFKDTLEY